ncbi:hypothetical protein [Streptacidiphilus fuscans]|uniref:Uncharacterized protein n=1 Tax=Streptacidiphilus fuscans TaxID=2789292 RepID=A0A931FHR1_9ACTN|nr:hypothetical protein [Streptacidiphilus fuscans]MBF9073908.1 hypothetical protein [Streptacidiphilus fuscans]
MGDQPVVPEEVGEWEVFARLPRTTWAMDRAWRRQMARAFDDLADDLDQGRWPQPACTAEEMALHLAIEEAPGYLEQVREDKDNAHHAMPEHENDYDWDACSDEFFQDTDVLMLFDPALAHLGEPGSDLAADAWFEPFGNTSARAPERGFRR